MKNRLKKIFCVRNEIAILGVEIIVCSLIYLIGFHGFGTPISYVLYLLMSYSLIVICIKVYFFVYNKRVQIMNQHYYYQVYMNDARLKHKVSLFVSLFFNVIYVLFKLIAGIMYQSLWFISFALYYFLLVIMRVNLAREEIGQKSSLKDEYEKYRMTAIILLFMIVILTVIILIIVNEKMMNIYPDWIALAIATYTFYLVFISFYNWWKYRRYQSPLISASKVIHIVTSLISFVSLEMVLIPTFGVNNVEFYEMMIMITGGCISLVIVMICLYMIVKSTEWLNTKNNELR